MITKTRNHSSNIFIIMLYIFFTLFAFIILLLGSTLYSNINSSANDTYALRTSLSFVSTKIRQSPTTADIKIDDDKIGVKSLVIEEKFDDSTYQTWIYHFEGALYEIYINEDIDFEPLDGFKIVDIYEFDYDISDVITLAAKTKSNKSSQISIAMRSKITTAGGNTVE